MREQIWQAIVDCDARYDGQFYYGLRTTKIYCRPSCKSRTPNPQNVVVFGSAQEAEAFGLRPCKRCRPELLGDYSAAQELTERAAALIENRFTEELTLKGLAHQLFVSPFHLQRQFTQVKGCSPAKYLLQVRIEAARQLLLTTDATVTAIALQTGFRTPSYFAGQFRKETRCTPTLFRKRNRPSSKDETLVTG